MKSFDPVYWVSAESILTGRANGGGDVLARTLLVGLPVYLLAVRLKAVLQPNATLRDVIIVVRADEAGHRDVNHDFANQLSQ